MARGVKNKQFLFFPASPSWLLAPTRDLHALREYANLGSLPAPVISRWPRQLLQERGAVLSPLKIRISFFVESEYAFLAVSSWHSSIVGLYFIHQRVR